ncbi:MAG: type I DNA topoisomerase [Clostridia bacterium]|nr:type I DNA topoisomerase [Clostridia bacterium]
MANLVILESPTKVGTVKGYLGSNYRVIASQGHVRDLPKSTLGIDIDNDFAPHYINIRGKGDLIKTLKKEVKGANKIFLATDPDREGEAIAWHLVTALGIPENKIYRATFNSLTKGEVKAGIKNPRAIDMNLVNAQQTRRILDRIVGYKLSPFLWKTVKSGLSAGRVQSVATRVIVERENEIRAFVPEEYWTIDANLAADGKPFTARFWGNTDGKIKLTCEDDANAVLRAAASGFTVKSIRRAVRHKAPTPPFTTSTLQQEAWRKLGFQSQRIMRVAQELYEGINLGAEFGGVQGLITYMRTDSLRVSSEAQEMAGSYILDKYGEQYVPGTPRVYKSRTGAQDAHEAIRPARVEIEPAKIKKNLTQDQYRLYKLIWERFVASQMESAELNTITADFEAGGYLFRTSGYTVKFQGFMAVYEATEEENVRQADDPAEERGLRLPDITEGQVLDTLDVKPQRHFTEPPPRYNEASLIKFFEEKGIGRPSTYTPIITTIIARGYVNRENKAFVPTPLGEVTTKLMEEKFPDIVDYQFTAEMEDDLDGIEKGENTMLAVLHDFWHSFLPELEAAQATVSRESIELPVEETDIICEKCGATMIIKNGRYGKFAACPNYPQCKNTKALDAPEKAEETKQPVVADFKCEVCGADMVLRTGRYGSFYACSRYPECKHTKQKNKELDVDCPKCGAKLVTKYGRGRTVFYSCSRYPDCDFSSWDMPTSEKCPDCGGMLFRKKGKNQLICHEKTCGYKRELPPEVSVETESEESNA